MIRRRRTLVDSVLFLQSSTLYQADAQVHASIAGQLVPMGFPVFVACNAGAESAPSPCITAFRLIPGVTVLPARFGPAAESQGRLAGASSLILSVPSIFASVVGMARYVRKHHIGAVHCSEKMREAVIGFAVARLSGARLVVHLHLKVEGWFSAPTRWVMHRADRLVAISEFVAQSAIQMGYDPEHVSVVLNGLTSPVADFAPDPGDRAWMEQQFGVPSGALIILIAARINRWKGHRALLDALASIAETAPPFILLAAGKDDPDETSPEMTTDGFRRVAAQLGIANRVTFTGFRRDVSRLIRSCDIFSMPSDEEPFGLVYIEAMTAARPVVAQESGGAPEIVVDGVTGLLSAPGDIRQLGDNLSSLLDDEALRHRLGDAGRERALRLFSAQRMATDMLAVYRSLSPDQ